MRGQSMESGAGLAIASKGRVALDFVFMGSTHTILITAVVHDALGVCIRMTAVITIDTFQCASGPAVVATETVMETETVTEALVVNGVQL